MFDAKRKLPASPAITNQTMDNLLHALCFGFLFVVVLGVLTDMNQTAAVGHKSVDHLQRAVIAGDVYTVPLERAQYSDFAPLARDGFLVMQTPRDDTNAFLICLKRADGVMKAFTGKFDALGFTPEAIEPTTSPALVARCEKGKG